MQKLQNLNDTSGQAQQDPELDVGAMIRSGAAAVLAFTAGLYRAVSTGGTGNLVCSPYSVAATLAMAAQGARGATRDQILDVLDADRPADAQAADARAEQVGRQLGALTAALDGPPDEPDEPDTGAVLLASANSVWVHHGLALRPQFLDVLTRTLHAQARTADFAADPDGARREVNAWVGERTRDRIDQLLPPGAVGPQTRLLLVNALYLKAPWATPFGWTADEPFTRLDGGQVSCPLMNAEALVGYASGPGWAAVDLPYAGGELAMAVILPGPGRFEQIQAGLDGPWLAALLAGFSRSTVALTVPRWTIRTPVELSGALAGLGMPLAFTPRADFGGMAGGQDLHVDAAVHEGYIAVDEDGTEAAAATGLAMRTVAAAMDPVEFRADRPLLFVVHHVPTGTPLFIGRVLDPTG